MGTYRSFNDPITGKRVTVRGAASTPPKGAPITDEPTFESMAEPEEAHVPGVVDEDETETE